MNEMYSIIADPESEGWEFAKKVYELLRIRSEQFELNEVKIKRFRDGEIKPKIEKNVRRKICFFIHDSSKSPKDWFLELCLINQAIKKSSALEVVDVLPYLRFSRQDRKDESRVPISARVIADVIEKYTDGVLTLDVHTPAIDGFYNIRFDNLYSFATVVKHLREKYSGIFENLVIMSPDAGGTERATAFAKMVGISDVAVGYKVRKTAGEVDDLKIMGDVKDKNVLLIDDIVDSGNTLVKAASVARAAGAKKVYAYCTHGLFTKGIDVAKNFDRFFVGDTLKQKNTEGLEVISFVPLFAEAIYRISRGESLSALYG